MLRQVASPALPLADRPIVLGNFLGNNSRHAQPIVAFSAWTLVVNSTSSHLGPIDPTTWDTFREL
jgi:hypothetical protein